MKSIDMTIENPSSSIREYLQEIAPNTRIAIDVASMGVGFLKSFYLFSPSTLVFMDPAPSPWLYSLPFILYEKWKNHKKLKEEKERAYQDVIRKQQTIIRKLQEKNYKNEQELKNLREAEIYLREILKTL